MFLQYVFGVFAITLVNSQVDVPPHDQVFECFSWGDPHIQTWHPKTEGPTHNRDCYANGHHTLLSNKYCDFKVHIQNTLTVDVDVKFYDGQTKEVICHIHSKNFHSAMGDHKCEKHGITLTTSLTGTESTFNVHHPAANLLTSIRENGHCPHSCYYNIYVWQPQSLVDQSTGICVPTDPGCSVRALGTNDLEWSPVRSSSQRQFISSEQAKSICNQYVDAYFIKTRRAPYQRNANLNMTVASVLAGCVDDLMITGDIEMAQGGLDVLMMEELTKDATSIDSIKTALQSGIEGASAVRNDAVKMAQVGIRRVL